MKKIVAGLSLSLMLVGAPIQAKAFSFKDCFSSSKSAISRLALSAKNLIHHKEKEIMFSGASKTECSKDGDELSFVYGAKNHETGVIAIFLNGEMMWTKKNRIDKIRTAYATKEGFTATEIKDLGRLFHWLALPKNSVEVTDIIDNSAFGRLGKLRMDGEEYSIGNVVHTNKGHSYSTRAGVVDLDKKGNIIVSKLFDSSFCDKNSSEEHKIKVTPQAQKNNKLFQPSLKNAKYLMQGEIGYQKERATQKIKQLKSKIIEKSHDAKKSILNVISLLHNDIDYLKTKVAKKRKTEIVLEEPLPAPIRVPRENKDAVFYKKMETLTSDEDIIKELMSYYQMTATTDQILPPWPTGHLVLVDDKSQPRTPGLLLTELVLIKDKHGRIDVESFKEIDTRQIKVD